VRLLPIVSERDVVRHLHQRGAAVLLIPVRDHDRRRDHVHADDSVSRYTMTDRRIRHVPVVAEGALVAIVSIGDIVKHRIDSLQSERDQL
jgi:CBS domain-containing protein